MNHYLKTHVEKQIRAVWQSLAKLLNGAQAEDEPTESKYYLGIETDRRFEVAIERCDVPKTAMGPD